MRLTAAVPHRIILERFIDEYRRCPSYWYVPRPRTLNDEYVADAARILAIVRDEFLGQKWSAGLQTELRLRLEDAGIQHGRTTGATESDRNALVRINKKLLEVLGLLWAEQDEPVFLTEAGIALVDAHEAGGPLRGVIDAQVAKSQYPNPVMGQSYAKSFSGLIPHLFLLDVLERLGQELSFEEFELFINLARSHHDTPRIAEYITVWRDLSEENRGLLRDVVGRVRLAKATGGRLQRLAPVGADIRKRMRRKMISDNGSYQRAFYGFPAYLQVDSAAQAIRSVEPEAVSATLDSLGRMPVVPEFATRADWFAYMGDPAQQPSWFSYIAQRIADADTEDEAKSAVSEAPADLTADESLEIKRRQVEKAIELSYAEHEDLLHTLERGLKFVDRQVETPVGRIDLLCRAADGQFVVVEIKAQEVRDAAFGQILRYMGWVNQQMSEADQTVRGILLAGGFPMTAEYSRYGLQRSDADQFLKFRKHGFAVESV